MKLSDDTSVRYYTWVDDRMGGPYTVEGLESLVYLQKITAETLVCREGSEEFTPIKNSELSLVLFPKAKFGTGSQAPHEWAPPRRENDPAFLNRKRYRTTEAKFENVNAKAANLPKIDVYNLLDDIRQTEIESGADRVRLNRFRISKRSRDFWIMLVAGNSLFLGGALISPNTTSLVFGIAGCGLFTFGLLWSMYGVMDRY
jgi:hypothetical protein